MYYNGSYPVYYVDVVKFSLGPVMTVYYEFGGRRVSVGLHVHYDKHR